MCLPRGTCSLLEAIVAGCEFPFLAGLLKYISHIGSWRDFDLGLSKATVDDHDVGCHGGSEVSQNARVDLEVRSWIMSLSAVKNWISDPKFSISCARDAGLLTSPCFVRICKAASVAGCRRSSKEVENGEYSSELSVLFKMKLLRNEDV